MQKNKGTSSIWTPIERKAWELPVPKRKKTKTLKSAKRKKGVR